MSSLKDLTLYDFQIEAVVQAYLHQGLNVIYDAGTGKSIIGIATAAMMLDDDMVDNVLLICERNKLLEWEEDFQRFTTLDALRYHGQNRKKTLARSGMPQVLITTYETAKIDVARIEKFKRGKTVVDGELLAQMLGRRWLVLYDESARLSNRGSGIYKSHQHMLKRLRQEGGARSIGFTATPIERDWESAYNQLRLICPDQMPLVRDFEKNFVLYRDAYGRAVYNFAKMPEFVAMARSCMIRKRKTDPDVRAQFPAMVEESKRVNLSTEHRRLYDLCVEVGTQADGSMVPGAYTILRQIAGHPASIVHSAREGTSELAQALVEELGEHYLRQIPCAKFQALTEHLRAVVMGQGAKVVVFTAFGQSVLREIEFGLRDEGFKVFPYHGKLTSKEAEETVKAFRGCADPCVFLSSDSGSQGINLPEATYVVEYESALTYAKRVQRINRINRLTSESASVHCLTLVANGTVEDQIVQNMLRRNLSLDMLTGDTESEYHVSAADRALIFEP